MPTADNWTDFRKDSHYREALVGTAKAFVALRAALGGNHTKVYETAVSQLVQAPMEFDGGKRRYLRARWRLAIYEYEDAPHGEHPWTKKETKALIGRIIDQASAKGIANERLVAAITEILDARQDTVLMTRGHQYAKAGFIRGPGDGFIDRYLGTAPPLVDRRDGRLLSDDDVRAIQRQRQARWESALTNLLGAP